MELLVFDVTVARDGLDLDKAVEAGEGTGYDTHRVQLMHADQLVGEQAGPRYGLGADIAAQSMAYTTLFLWAGLQRMGIQVPEFPLFKGRVIDITKIEPTDETGEEEGGGDPTTPGRDTDWP